MPLGATKVGLFGAAGGGGDTSAGGNYLGDGSDGDVTYSSNTDLTVLNKNGSYDGDMIVKNYSSLVIDSGVTVQPDQPCRGMLIYVQGDCTITGTLRIGQGGKGGALADPTSSGGSDSSAVSSTGLRYPVITSGGSDSLGAADFAGCGDAAVAAVANQAAISSSGDILKVNRIGGDGGAGGSGGATTGRTGTAGATGATTISTGGGGTGSWQDGGSGAGSQGSCFAGGSGSGGGHGGTSSAPTDHGGAAGTTGQCGCFLDGTTVELSDGHKKPISEIDIGNSLKTGQGDDLVTHLFHTTSKGQKIYGFNDKEPFVTESHPFMTQDGWKRADEIIVGDFLHKSGSERELVEYLSFKKTSPDTPVYNFHVGEHETYYADDYLVHNKGNSGGGAGNPGAAGCGVGSIGQSGCGGLLYLIVGGDLEIASGGTISAKGSNGGGSDGGTTIGGGGASGGGAIFLAHVGSFTNNGTLSLAGGISGQSSRGGPGGAGGTHTIQIS